MKIGIDVTAWLNGAELTLKTINNPVLAVITQPEAEALIEQLVYALKIATECDMMATEVIRNNHTFEKKIDIQPG